MAGQQEDSKRNRRKLVICGVSSRVRSRVSFSFQRACEVASLSLFCRFENSSLLRVTQPIHEWGQSVNPLLLTPEPKLLPSPGLRSLSLGPPSKLFPTTTEPSTWHEQLLWVEKLGSGCQTGLLSWVDLRRLGRHLRLLWAGGRRRLSFVLGPSVWV